MSQGSNYYRFEDSLGFVWITGNDAVNRYDGNFIKVYKKDYYFENCQNLQQGYGFAEDNNHNIYIGSTNGLYAYIRKKDRFNVVFLLPKGNDQTVFPIGFSKGKVWCHNKNFDVIAYDIKSNTSKVYNTSSSYKVASFHVYDNSLNPIFTRIPFIDTDDNLWIVNPNGLLFFDTKTNKLQRYLEKYLIDNELKIISSNYDKYTHTILIGTNNCLLVFNCSSGSIEKGAKTRRVECIATNKSIIAIKDKENFAIFDKAIKKIYTQKLNENLATSYCYSFDKMNRLWMCQDGFGQMILDFNSPFLKKVTSTNELFKFGVGNFTEFKDGTYLVQDNVVFNKEKRHFEKIHGNLNTSLIIKNVTDIKHKIIWQIVQNNDQTIDLFQLNENKKLTFYSKLSKIPQLGLLQDIVLLENQLLCSFQSGLYLIDTKEKALKKLANQIKKNPFKINLISKNRIIVSYLNQEATLYQLDKSNNIVHTQNILNDLQPFYFQEDTINNKIWVGTNNGIVVLDSNFKQINKIDANDNLAGTYIYGILLDEDGNCWASHQRGLSYIKSTNYTIVNFTKEDGIQDWDFNNRAYYKATDGTLFFGGMKGFNYFKPPLTNINSVYKSKVYIDEILINQNRLPNQGNYDYIHNLQLQPNENDISIHAIVRNIYKGKQTPIVYRINNSKWIYKSSDCTIDLVNLAPDNYKLELGVYDKFQNKIFIQKKLVLDIAFPFYYQIWFWYSVVFVLLLLFAVLLFIRKIKIIKRVLQQKLLLEQQRNKITADLHDDIGATLSSLQLNSAVANQLMENNPKEAHKLLEKIEIQSMSLSEKIGDIIWSMKPGKDQFMTLSTRIKNFSNEILGATDIQYNIHIEPILDELVKDITTRKNIVLLIKEAVNNAAKYSKATQLEINLSLTNATVQITITDNGIGFNANEIKGNGVHNMKRRTEELGGSFSINTQLHHGTTINATIPLYLN